MSEAAEHRGEGKEAQGRGLGKTAELVSPDAPNCEKLESWSHTTLEFTDSLERRPILGFNHCFNDADHVGGIFRWLFLFTS